MDAKMTGMPNYEADAAVADEEAKSASLEDFHKLVEAQLAAEAEVTRLADELKEATKALNEIKQGKLPWLMVDAGVEEFKFEGGNVKLHEDIKLSVPKDKKQWLADWLRKCRETGMIKRTVTVEVPEGPAGTKAANALVALAKKSKCPTAVKDFDFHTGSLKALLKNRRATGKPIPELGTIGGFEFQEARIKLKG